MVECEKQPLGLIEVSASGVPSSNEASVALVLLAAAKKQHTVTTTVLTLCLHICYSACLLFTTTTTTVNHHHLHPTHTPIHTHTHQLFPAACCQQELQGFPQAPAQGVCVYCCCTAMCFGGFGWGLKWAVQAAVHAVTQTALTVLLFSFVTLFTPATSHFIPPLTDSCQPTA